MTFRATLGGSAALLLVFAAREGRAAGFENGLPPTARHQALGGAMVAGGAGASSLFKNPAGLALTEGLEALGGLSLSFTQLQGVPPGATQTTADWSPQVLPVLAASARLAEWLSVGVGVAPVGALGGSYAAVRRNSWAYELTPGAAVLVPEDVIRGRLALGAAYQMTLAQQSSDSPGNRLDLWGFDGSGVRLGAQYDPIAELRLGASVRTPRTLTTNAGSAQFGGQSVTDASLPLTLPVVVSAGARFDLDRYGLAVDYDFLGTGNVDRTTLLATGASGPVSLLQRQGYKHGHVVRVGLEYRVPVGAADVPLRAGYVWESDVTTARFPDPFAPPPASAHTLTAGFGYQERDFQMNFAIWSRVSSAAVTAAELGSGCAVCGGAGDYALLQLGASVDASLHWEL